MIGGERRVHALGNQDVERLRIETKRRQLFEAEGRDAARGEHHSQQSIFRLHDHGAALIEMRDAAVSDLVLSELSIPDELHHEDRVERCAVQIVSLTAHGQPDARADSQCLGLHNGGRIVEASERWADALSVKFENQPSAVAR